MYLKKAMNISSDFWVSKLKTVPTDKSFSCLSSNTFFLPWFLYHIQCDFSVTDKTYCEIPMVKPMETTSLTCIFPEDLSVSKKDFSVVHINSTGKPGNNDQCKRYYLTHWWRFIKSWLCIIWAILRKLKKHFQCQYFWPYIYIDKCVLQKRHKLFF